MDMHVYIYIYIYINTMLITTIQMLLTINYE